jgi:hypothetical protein
VSGGETRLMIAGREPGEQGARSERVKVHANGLAIWR